MYCTFDFCSSKYHMVCAVSLKYSGERMRPWSRQPGAAFPAKLARLAHPLEYGAQAACAARAGGQGAVRGRRPLGLHRPGWAGRCPGRLWWALSHALRHSLRPA